MWDLAGVSQMQMLCGLRGVSSPVCAEGAIIHLQHVIIFIIIKSLVCMYVLVYKCIC